MCFIVFFSSNVFNNLNVCFGQPVQEAGVVANVVAYNSVINACARCGDKRRAEEWFSAMEAEGIQSPLL